MSEVTRRHFLTHLAIGAALTLPARAADSGKAMLRRAIPAATNGETLPVIGMGTWTTFDVGANAAERAPLSEVLKAFYAAGARLIDSSPMYGSAEAVTGDLVQQLDQQRNTFYATKVWTTGRQQGVAQIQQSMRLLRTTRLDLLQIHNLQDWRTQAMTLRALKAEGKLRYTGVTHYTTSSHADLESVMRTESFDFAQFNYSIATRAAEQRLLPFCQERGIAVLINRPFEEGALFAQVRGRKLPAYAAELGCTNWAQLFLKFIISHPAVTCVIPATSRVTHMQDNLSAGFGTFPDASMRQRMARDFAGN